MKDSEFDGLYLGEWVRDSECDGLYLGEWVRDWETEATLGLHSAEAAGSKSGTAQCVLMCKGLTLKALHISFSA